MPPLSRELEKLSRLLKDWLLVIVPLIRKEWDKVRHMNMLTLDLPPDAPTRWKNEFTGEVFQESSMPMTAEIFAGFPVTLLSGTSAVPSHKISSIHSKDP